MGVSPSPSKLGEVSRRWGRSIIYSIAMGNFYPLNEEEENEFFDYMMSLGVIKEHGVDEKGEMTYTFDFQAMKEWLPEMYEEMMSEINEKLMILYEQNLISIEYDETLKARFRSTEKGNKYFKTLGF